MGSLRNNSFHVIVIGGGITGAGVARDCAMRGLKVLLIEKHDLTHGASGRNHGLMHSGARYAVSDPENAAECIAENRILRRIARHCVEETDGLFISLPGDDLAYQQQFAQACISTGINAQIISTREAIELEPAVNPDIIGAVRVPDAAIDPFRLTMANILDAQAHGAQVITHHAVTQILTSGTSVTGVVATDSYGNKTEYHAPVVVNAAGIWGQHIAGLAGITLNMYPARGALLIFGHRVNNMVINRCRKPSNGDILVPDDIVCVLGTTSDRVPIDRIDDTTVTNGEVDLLLAEGVKLVPLLARTRILRAYAGIRPLVASDNDDSGRDISRGIVCIDHAKRDGMDGFITITGGKMMTYRLMAQQATDLVCRKLNVKVACTTAVTPLPGSEPMPVRDDDEDTPPVSFAHRAAEGRHGTLVSKIHDERPEQRALVCECEHVSTAEVNYAINELHASSLARLRRRTRLGMGTCQGKMCACRAAALMAGRDGDPETQISDLNAFLNERWKGIRPVAWGTALSEAQLSAMTYQSLCGMNLIQPDDLPKASPQTSPNPDSHEV